MSSLFMENKETISCDDCPGACCSNINIVMSSKDLLHLISGGSKILENLCFSYDSVDKPIWDNKPLVIKDGEIILKNTFEPEDAGEYYISGACGFLDKNGNCSDYDHRPDACKNFVVGSDECREKRDEVIGE